MKAVQVRVNKKEVGLLQTKDGKILGETEKKAGQLTLLGERIRDGIDAGDWDEGLCVRRFSENITADTLPALQPGDELYAGTLQLRITAAGKTCFPECRFQQAGTSCPLAEAAFFAEVTQDGIVRPGDLLQIKE